MNDLESELAAMLSRRANATDHDGEIEAVIAEARSPAKHGRSSRTMLLAAVAACLLGGIGIVRLMDTETGTQETGYADGATADNSPESSDPLIVTTTSTESSLGRTHLSETTETAMTVDGTVTASTTGPPTTSGAESTGAPSDEHLIFEDGFEDGHDMWRAVPARVQLTDTSREGNKALRFEAYPNREGSLMVPYAASFAWNKEYWVGFSLNVPVAPAGYGIVSQHQATPHTDPETGKPDWSCGAGPNSFIIKIVDQHFEVRTSTIASNVNATASNGSALWGTEAATAPFTLNKWHDFVLHFLYAPDETGFMEVWIDGVQVVDVNNSATVYSHDRCGEPRSERQSQRIGVNHGLDDPGGEVIFDAFRIGSGDASYGDVTAR